VFINTLVQMPACIPDTLCIAQITLVIVHYALLINWRWFWFTHREIFTDFVTLEYWLKSGNSAVLMSNFKKMYVQSYVYNYCNNCNCRFCFQSKNSSNKEFMCDKHLSDVLVFRAGTDLHNHPLYVSGCILLQDKVHVPCEKNVF